MSFNTNPLTVLLTPPNSSPTGSAGALKAAGAAGLNEFNADRIPCSDGSAGTGAGIGAGTAAGGAGGSGLYLDECLRLILRTPFRVIGF